MGYKLSFKCTHCQAKLQIEVSEGMYNKKNAVRCTSCNEITSVQVPSEQKFILSSQKKSNSISESTFVSDVFKKEKFIRLNVLANENTVSQSFDIDQERMTIGRKNNAGPKARPDVEVITSDGYMSKKHALITRKSNNSFIITDLGSANGTWLNGEKLSTNDSMYIENGDELKLGKTFFRIVITT